MTVLIESRDREARGLPGLRLTTEGRISIRVKRGGSLSLRASSAFRITYSSDISMSVSSNPESGSKIKGSYFPPSSLPA